MTATTDSDGRTPLPGSPRDSTESLPGTQAGAPVYGGGVQLTPGGRTARLERDADGRLVAVSDTVVTDDVLFALIDAGRR